RMFAKARANPRPKLPSLTSRPPALESIAVAASELLSTTVVSAAIDVLRRDPALAAWTREGLPLHRDRAQENCLFCEQPLPKGRLRALEAHFSAAYERFVTAIDAQVLQVRAASEIVKSATTPKTVELYEDLAADYGS